MLEQGAPDDIRRPKRGDKMVKYVLTNTLRDQFVALWGGRAPVSLVVGDSDPSNATEMLLGVLVAVAVELGVREGLLVAAQQVDG